MYTYKKVQDKYTTHTLYDPDESLTELCTIDGETYVLGEPVEQSEIIKKTLKEVELTSDLKKKIIDASPQIQLTLKRMDGREPKVRYSEEDERLLKELDILFESAEKVSLTSHIDESRLWAKEVEKEVEEVIAK